MPTVATIDGVKIQFYPDEHPPPHFHAVFAEFIAQIQIKPTQLLRGSLPPAKLKTVLAWAAEREAVLLELWITVAAGQKPDKIR